MIPARYAATRLPGKVLRDIAGRPMIEHVWRRAMRATCLARVLIATDDERVREMCPGHAPDRPARRTGSERGQGRHRLGRQRQVLLPPPHSLPTSPHRHHPPPAHRPVRLPCSLPHPLRSDRPHPPSKRPRAWNNCVPYSTATASEWSRSPATAASASTPRQTWNASAASSRHLAPADCQHGDCV
ncbi:hypothetical protein K2224_16190 [Streptomyces sp. BHT-5-2]|nr:hypothetical protein K2224_16190 [Streptomyces sp. BHT-5-2]